MHDSKLILTRVLVGLIACSWFAAGLSADERKPRPKAKKPRTADPDVPTPTLSDVRYGQHDRNVLDFWKAESATPTSNFGVKLREHCLAIGVKSELVYPGAVDVKHQNSTEYLIETLKRTRQ